MEDNLIAMNNKVMKTYSNDEVISKHSNDKNIINKRTYQNESQYIISLLQGISQVNIFFTQYVYDVNNKIYYNDSMMILMHALL